MNSSVVHQFYSKATHCPNRLESLYSKAGFLFEKVESVSGIDSCIGDAGKFLSLNHVNSVPLLVDNQAILLAFNDYLMLVSYTHLFVLDFLILQIVLVS